MNRIARNSVAFALCVASPVTLFAQSTLTELVLDRAKKAQVVKDMEADLNQRRSKLNDLSVTLNKTGVEIRKIEADMKSLDDQRATLFSSDDTKCTKYYDSKLGATVTKCESFGNDTARRNEISERNRAISKAWISIATRRNNVVKTFNEVDREMDTIKAWLKEFTPKYERAKDQLRLASEKVEKRQAETKTASVEIETRILDPDPEAGMKSSQTVKVDFENKSVSQNYRTGATCVPKTNACVGSVRDNFQIERTTWLADGVSLLISGETASGVAVMPNINYKFDLLIERGGEATLMSGCHDGYPAYRININGRPLYSFKHKPINLVKLFGTCDIQPARASVSAWFTP